MREKLIANTPSYSKPTDLNSLMNRHINDEIISQLKQNISSPIIALMKKKENHEKSVKSVATDPGITPMSKVATEFLNLLQKSTFDQVDSSYDKDYFCDNAFGSYFVSRFFFATRAA